VFIRWFGAESGKITLDDAARISHGIDAARAAHLPQ
jgi:hypothetical protein